MCTVLKLVGHVAQGFLVVATGNALVGQSIGNTAPKPRDVV